MKTNEVLKLFDKELLDKIYHFSYHRCNTSVEAEDLCSEIVLAVITAIHKQAEVKNFHAFVWTIAHRVYADYSEKRTAERRVISLENCDMPLQTEKNELDDVVEAVAEQEQIKRILNEIAFLSKAYREVMVLYYIDGLKVKEIAMKLAISETTVKQRLFSARNIVRKEVETMSERNLSLKPVRLSVVGIGHPRGNEPNVKAERMLSQNLIYLCKEKPKSAKELSEELCVPMPYIEEELEIQCHGQNGTYGMLRRLDNGKYAINIHLLDYTDYVEVNKIYEKYLSEFCRILKQKLSQSKERILALPYLSEQNDLRFILWTLIARIDWRFELRLNEVIAKKYFSDIAPVEREYSCAAVAFREDQRPVFHFYGCDEIGSTFVPGYKTVVVSNVYGERIDKHFSCGHSISTDPKLLMVLRAIGGLPLEGMTEEEKEIAAKALECGYLRKKDNMVEPQIIVLDRRHVEELVKLQDEFVDDMADVIEDIAKEVFAYMKKHIPEHLLNEYDVYTRLLAGSELLPAVIEECIKEGLLLVPENRLGAEGVLMIVEK